MDLISWDSSNPEQRSANWKEFSRASENPEAIERIEAMEQEQSKAPERWQQHRLRLPAAAATAPAVSARAKIGIEDFAKIEMRVGQVKSAERVAGADKLLQLQVDIGDESPADRCGARAGI